MKLPERLKRIEDKISMNEKDNSFEVIFYQEGEDAEQKVKEREAELGKKFYNPILIRIISSERKNLNERP